MDDKEDLWNQITYLTNKNAKEEKKKKKLEMGIVNLLKRSFIVRLILKN